MLTIDEYMALRRLIESERESEGAEVVQEKPKRKRRASKYNRNFAKAYRKIKKAKPRTKHANILKQAHKLAKRMK